MVLASNSFFARCSTQSSPSWIACALNSSSSSNFCNTSGWNTISSGRDAGARAGQWRCEWCEWCERRSVGDVGGTRSGRDAAGMRAGCRTVLAVVVLVVAVGWWWWSRGLMVVLVCCCWWWWWCASVMCVRRWCVCVVLVVRVCARVQVSGCVGCVGGAGGIGGGWRLMVMAFLVLVCG